MKINKSAKFLLLLIIFLFPKFLLLGQIIDPIGWKFEQKRINDTTAELIMTAKIQRGWHLYSQFISKDIPVSTEFKFAKSNNYKLISTVTEPTPIEKYEEALDAKVKYFEKEAIFKQKIKITTNSDFKLKGTVTYSCCDNTKCIPPTDASIDIKIEGAKTFIKQAKPEPISSVEKTTATDSGTKVIKTSTIETVKTEIKEKKTSGFWLIFLEGIIWGFIALLTPCVFPMIPLTVSFFIKREKNRKRSIEDALIYGSSIISIFVILGLGITLIFGSDALNNFAANPWVNLGFFVLLIVFAAAFFGMFEIRLPHKWVNAMDKKSEESRGFSGIFFMAFTLVLVSFSCTGPLIGTLLVDTVTKGLLGPFAGMLGFSIALAIPFTVFAIFPSWLNSLPKSGGWLNSIKVTLGFLELAFALKFLSNADLVCHWHLLSRDVFLVLWIVIFTLLGIYLLGKIRFAYDSEVKVLSIPRFLFAMISFSFALYLVPGLWGAPLSFISGYTPPMETQSFVLNKQSEEKNLSKDSLQSEKKKYSDIFQCPLGINCYFDYEEGLQYAKKVNKPVMLDFTGFTCSNCRMMEHKVWSDKSVLKLLNEKYVVISLYVDDYTPLKESEQYISKIGNRERKVKSIGNKWSDFQAKRFNANSQPFYVLLDTKGNQLTTPHAFDLSVDNFVNFLNRGVIEFEKKKDK